MTPVSEAVSSKAFSSVNDSSGKKLVQEICETAVDNSDPLNPEDIKSSPDQSEVMEEPQAEVSDFFKKLQEIKQNANEESNASDRIEDEPALPPSNIDQRVSDDKDMEESIIVKVDQKRQEVDQEQLQKMERDIPDIVYDLSYFERDFYDFVDTTFN